MPIFLVVSHARPPSLAVSLALLLCLLGCSTIPPAGTRRSLRQAELHLDAGEHQQAVTLADKPGDITNAVSILQPVLANDSRRQHWLDLIARLQACELLERSGAARELLAALG